MDGPGRVHLDTPIQLEGAAEWKPVSSFPELAVPPVVNLPRLPARERNDSLAQGSLICGVLSILCCCASPLFGVLGLIFSIIVLTRRQDYPGENGRQMALAGLILSIIGLLWHSLLPLFFLLPRGYGLHHYRLRWM